MIRPRGPGGWMRMRMGIGLALAMALAVPDSGPAWAQAGAANDPRFVIERVQIDGATLLDPARLQAAAAPMLRRDIGFADLEALRAALEAVYRDAGWRLVRVRLPAQTLEPGGSVRFEVIEPRLDQVSFANAQGAEAARWRARLPALREGGVPNLAELDRQLTLANEQPGQQVQVSFSVPPGGDGRSLRAEVQTRSAEPAAWTAFIDNTGNDSTGKLRYGLAWRHARLFDSDQQLNVQVVSAPHDADDPQRFSLLPSRKVRIVGLSWRLPLPEAAASVDATLGYSSVDSGQLQDLFKVTGRGSTAQIRFTQLWQRRGAWQPRAFVAWDWRRYDNRTEFGGFNLGQPLVLSPLSLGVQALAPSTPQQPDSLLLHATLVLNLPAGDQARQANFDADRSGSRRQYRLLRAGGQWQTALAQGDLALNVEAQWSPDALPSGEQFSAGGVGSVRGFADRGISGDSGVRTQLEWTGGNLLGAGAAEQGLRLRPVLFVDAAWVRRHRALLLERAESSIASAGLGLRLSGPNWAARIDWGQAIHQRTASTTGKTRGAAHASLALSF